MKASLINIGILSSAFLILFGIAEVLFHKYKVRAEHSRKLVHFGTGALTMLFPLFLTSHWQVLLMSVGFLAILILSKKYNFLNSINGVERKTHGSTLFPIVVYLCFALAEYKSNFSFFYLPILILAISDPIAALLGQKFPLGKFTLLNHTKTLMGSFGFLFSAALITSIVLSFKLNMNCASGLYTALIIAILSTFAEAISKDGWDNLTIPLSVTLVLMNLNFPVLC